MNMRCNDWVLWLLVAWDRVTVISYELCPCTLPCLLGYIRFVSSLHPLCLGPFLVMMHFRASQQTLDWGRGWNSQYDNKIHKIQTNLLTLGFEISKFTHYMLGALAIIINPLWSDHRLISGQYMVGFASPPTYVYVPRLDLRLSELAERDLQL